MGRNPKRKRKNSHPKKHGNNSFDTSQSVDDFFNMVDHVQNVNKGDPNNTSANDSSVHETYVKQVDDGIITPAPGNVDHSDHNTSGSVSPNTQVKSGKSSTPTPAPRLSLTTPPPWVDKLFAKLSCMEASISKINKIDSIEANIAKMTKSVQDLGTRVSHVEKMTGNLGNKTGDLQKEINSLKSQLADSNAAIDKLNDQFVDMQCRSMRDNLLFFGLAERKDGRGPENCMHLLDEFCEEQLDFEGPVSQYIDRAHRIGKYTTGKIRPIVAKFNDFKIREEVRLSSHQLRNTRYSIQQQYPKPIADRRKELQPVMHNARQQKKRVALVKDKLYINGELYVRGTEGDTAGASQGE